MPKTGKENVKTELTLLPEDQRTYQFIEPNVIIAGLHEKDGVRHYSRFTFCLACNGDEPEQDPA